MNEVQLKVAQKESEMETTLRLLKEQTEGLKRVFSDLAIRLDPVLGQSVPAEVQVGISPGECALAEMIRDSVRGLMAIEQHMQDTLSRCRL